MIHAIVLAAGKSERMGRPKALLSLHGRTFLETILDAIAGSSIGWTVVVTGRHHQEIQERFPLPNLVYNPDYEKGMITSLQAGIRALPPEVDGAMLFLVDHPMVESQTIDALVVSFKAGHISLPVFQGRRGHPVLFSASVLEEIIALPQEQGANIVVRKDPRRIVEVPLNTPGIIIDIDTPEDYARLLEARE